MINGKYYLTNLKVSKAIFSSQGTITILQNSFRDLPIIVV